MSVVRSCETPTAIANIGAVFQCWSCRFNNQLSSVNKLLAIRHTVPCQRLPMLISIYQCLTVTDMEFPSLDKRTFPVMKPTIHQSILEFPSRYATIVNLVRSDVVRPCSRHLSPSIP